MQHRKKDQWPIRQKQSNTCVIRFLERWEKGIEKIFKETMLFLKMWSK